MAFVAPQKVRTLQEEAQFYVSPINPRKPEGRRWWQTMSVEKMKKMILKWVVSENVQPELKAEGLKILDSLWFTGAPAANNYKPAPFFA